MRKIVLVDDDELYREALSADLADLAFQVSSFADGPSFLDALQSGIQPDVALLDWAMPELSGLELLRTIRDRGIQLPVVFARELQAFKLGAVDFVDKAKGVDILAHRVRVIIEGQYMLPLGSEAGARRHGFLTLSPITARAFWRLHDVGLTMTEYKIVEMLVSNKGKVQTYRTIYDVAHYAGFVAGTGELGHHPNVRSMVKRIRKKFLAVDPGFAEIENVEKVGYLWRDPSDEAAVEPTFGGQEQM